MSWTPEKEEKLRHYWKKGFSGSQIANLLGDTTRNAVIGKAHRLKLQARTVSKKTENKISTEKNVSPESKNQKLGRKAKFKALLLSKDMEKENPIQLEDCSDKLCRWPNNHPGDKDFYFCGRTALEGAVYCSLHFLIAFQAKNAKEEDRITDDDIPDFIQKKIKSA